MIEVNLLPGGKKRRGGGGGGLSIPMPDFSKIPADPFILGAAVIGVLSVGLLGWMWMGVRSDAEEVQVALTDARADSANFADLIARNEALEARRDSVGQKVEIIQAIDAGRYVWPHIMDEVARALPDFTWLTSVVQISAGDDLQFEIQGQAGNLFAQTRFMEQLESSPFIRRIRVISSEQAAVQDAAGDTQIVYQFTLEMSWEEPPPELLQTVPLFDDAAMGAAQAQTAQDPVGNDGNGEGN